MKAQEAEIIPPQSTRKKTGKRGRTTLPPALRATTWKPGQSGNPNGWKGSKFLECVQVCREASAEAAQRMIILMADPDSRVALMACDKIMERAWGKPKEVQDDKTAGPPDLGALNAGDLAELRRIAGKMRAQDAPAPPPEAPPARVEPDAGDIAVEE